MVCSCPLFHHLRSEVLVHSQSASKLIRSHGDRNFRGELSRMYSPTPTKYITCAMPNRGAMTRARQPAPFRKAEGPSFLIILLWRTRGTGLLIQMHTKRRGEKKVSCYATMNESTVLPHTIHNSTVSLLSWPFVQGLQSSLHHLRENEIKTCQKCYNAATNKHGTSWLTWLSTHHRRG